MTNRPPPRLTAIHLLSPERDRTARPPSITSPPVRAALRAAPSDTCHYLFAPPSPLAVNFAFHLHPLLLPALALTLTRYLFFFFPKTSAVDSLLSSRWLLAHGLPPDSANIWGGCARVPVCDSRPSGYQQRLPRRRPMLPPYLPATSPGATSAGRSSAGRLASFSIVSVPFDARSDRR